MNTQLDFEVIAKHLVDAAGEWKAMARRAVLAMPLGVEFVLSDAAAAVGLPDPTDSHQWGAVAYALKRERVIEAAGYGQSSRPGVRGSAVRLWRRVP